MTTLSRTLDFTPSWMVEARKPRPRLLDWVKSFWIIQEDFGRHYVIRSWNNRLQIRVELDPDPDYSDIPQCAWRFWRRLGLELDRYAGQATTFVAQERIKWATAVKASGVRLP